MVEVFKTNVEDPELASFLVHLIHKSFSSYQANFDLDDCDRILRVKSTSGSVESSLLLNLLNRFGFHCEILSDDIPARKQALMAAAN